MKNKKHKILKKAPVQLSLMAGLFEEENKETLFIDSLLNELKNCKWLRTRIEFSSLKKIEKLSCTVLLSDALEAASTLLYKMSKRTFKYRDHSQEDFLKLLFYSKIDFPPTEHSTLLQIREHHDSVISRVNTAFVGFEPYILEYDRYYEKVVGSIRQSHIILQRLTKNIVQ